MKTLDIRFRQETEKNAAAQQLELMNKLTERLPQRIAEKYDDVNVRIRFSSSPGYDLTGFKGDDKTAFLAFLEEIWNDDSLIE